MLRDLSLMEIWLLRHRFKSRKHPWLAVRAAWFRKYAWGGLLFIMCSRSCALEFAASTALINAMARQPCRKSSTQ